MMIKNKILIINSFDLDHIISYIKDNKISFSEQFIKGLEIELKLNGLENETYEKIELELNGDLYE